MSHSDNINALTWELTNVLREYAQKVMNYNLEEEVNGFIDGYFECITVGDDNDNDQHWVSMMLSHIEKIKQRSFL